VELQRDWRTFIAWGWAGEQTTGGIAPAMECAEIVLIHQFWEGKRRGILQLSEGKRRGRRGSPVPCCGGDRGRMVQRLEAVALHVLFCTCCCSFLLTGGRRQRWAGPKIIAAKMKKNRVGCRGFLSGIKEINRKGIEIICFF
jgi:hypothetical protein